MAPWTRFETGTRQLFTSPLPLSKVLLSGALILMAAFPGAPPAHAQASRTFVSGVGDDANPCSRTAPCKTFAGAISKTAAHGEINVLDAGGFGAVTITKSITIDGGESFASILAAGVNGVIISHQAPAGDPLIGSHITLRNLSIDGFNSALNGINILAADEVYIENVTIFNSKGNPGRGIIDNRTTANGELFVTNTTIQDNSSNGIAINPNGGSVKATLNGVRSFGNGNAGFAALNGVQASIVDSEFSSNIDGIQVGNNAQVNIDRTIINNNTTGINSFGNGTTRVSNSMIMNNSANGIAGLNVFGTNPGTNMVEGNGGTQTFGGSILLK